MFLTEWSEQVPGMSFSVANLKDVRDQSDVFESLVGYNGANFILTAEGTDAERVSGRQVTSGLFATFRKQPIPGRPFGPEEDSPARTASRSSARGSGSGASGVTRRCWARS